MSDLGDWLRKQAELCDSNPALTGAIYAKAGDQEVGLATAARHLPDHISLASLIFSASQAVQSGGRTCERLQ